jgi:acetyl-CoA carboxylase carboxyl transferase subunit alpha
MLEFTYYSVISPEGCASILWKGSEHAPKAAAALKLTSRDLLRFGIIDEVIAEPPGGAHRDHREAAASLKSFLVHSIRRLRELPIDELLARRYDKFRKMGVFEEKSPDDASRNGPPDSPGPSDAAEQTEEGKEAAGEGSGDL